MRACVRVRVCCCWQVVHQVRIIRDAAASGNEAAGLGRLLCKAAEDVGAALMVVPAAFGTRPAGQQRSLGDEEGALHDWLISNSDRCVYL